MNKAFHRELKVPVKYKKVDKDKVLIPAMQVRSSADPGEWIAVGIQVLLLAQEIWGPLKRLIQLVKAWLTKDKELEAEVKLHAQAAKALKDFN